MVNKMLFAAAALAVQVSWAQNLLDVFDDSNEDEIFRRELEAELEDERRNLDSDSIFRRDLHGWNMRDALRSLEGSDDEKDDPDADEDASTDEAEKSEDEVEEVKEKWANRAKGPWKNYWFRSDHYSE